VSSINNGNLTVDGGIANNETNYQFGMELSEASTKAKPRYGNIASVKWKAGNVNGTVQSQYGFDYSLVM